jgi:hypothetical protein
MGMVSRAVSRLNGSAEAAAADQAAITEFLRLSRQKAGTLAYAAELVYRKTFDVPDAIPNDQRDHWDSLVGSPDDHRVESELTTLRQRVAFFSLLQDISIAKGVGDLRAKGAVLHFAHNLLMQRVLILGPWHLSLTSYRRSSDPFEASGWNVYPVPRPWPPVRRRFDAYGMLKSESGVSRLDSYDDVITDSLIESMPYEAGQLAEAVGFKYRAKLAPIVGTKWCDPDLK